MLTWLSWEGMWNGCRGSASPVEQVARRRFVGDEQRAETRGDHGVGDRALGLARDDGDRDVGAAEGVEGDAHGASIEVVVDDAAVGADVTPDTSPTAPAATRRSMSLGVR